MAEYLYTGVYVEEVEWLTNPIAGVSTSESDNPCFPCVEEACVIGVRSDVPPSVLAVARLLRLDKDWTVDVEFAAPRVV